MSREEAIEELQILKYLIRMYAEPCKALDMAIEALKGDVSDTNVGEWIPMYNGKFTGGAYWFSCSTCKRVVPDVQNGDWEYCPGCGKRNILNR